MNRWVGVQSILFGGSSIKQEALMFDRIAVLGLDFALAVIADPRARKVLRIRPTPKVHDLSWLMQQGIVFDLETELPDDDLIDNEEFEKYKDLRQQYIEKKNSALRKTTDNNNDGSTRLALYAKYADKANEYLLRELCVQLRELCNMEAYPIFPYGINPFQESNAPKTDVVQIVFNALPVPDDSTSWEQIFEYRSDPNSQNKFLDLRNWMNEVARAKLTPIEIEQKLEYLMSQYQRHMELHKMKTNVGTMETYLTIGAEFLEELLRLKPSKAVKSLFSLKHRRITLMEGELTSPGSEVAYLIKSEEAFSEQAQNV